MKRERDWNNCCSLRFSHCHDLFLSRVSTTRAQARSFASIGPSLWNHLFCIPLLSVPLSSSLSLLKSHLVPGAETHWEHFYLPYAM